MEIPEEVKIFLVESNENLDRAEQELLSLERDPSDLKLVNSVFRAIHTIKGNSGFLGYKNLEQLCHRGEALLDCVRSNKVPLTQPVVSALLEVLDASRDLLLQIESEGQESSPAKQDLIARLEALSVPAK